MFKGICYGVAEQLPKSPLSVLKGHALLDIFSHALGHESFNELHNDSRTYGEGSFELTDFMQHLTEGLQSISTLPAADVHKAVVRAGQQVLGEAFCLNQIQTQFNEQEPSSSGSTRIGQEAPAADGRYLPKHYPENQTELYLGVIPVNPSLPTDFDCIEHEERSSLEIQHWWGRPFIVSDTYSGETTWTVRCLNGGAWDRSSGIAFGLESKAAALCKAEQALARPVFKSADSLANTLENQTSESGALFINADDLMAPNPYRNSTDR